MIKQTLMALAMAGFALTVTDSEAQRVGGDRKSGAAPPAATKTAQKEEDVKSSVPAPGPDPDALRRQNEEKILRATEEDEKRRALEEQRAAAIAAYEKERAEERQRFAKAAQEREAVRLKQARESQCQFKPVMSDADLANCRAVYK